MQDGVNFRVDLIPTSFVFIATNLSGLGLGDCGRWRESNIFNIFLSLININFVYVSVYVTV